MKKSLIFAISTFLVTFFAAGTIAELYPDNQGVKSYQCGNLFIEEGVHSFQVRQNCGEPVYLEIFETGYDDGGSYSIEKWVYGPEAGYYYILYFKYGVLIKLSSARVIW